MHPTPILATFSNISGRPKDNAPFGFRKKKKRLKGKHLALICRAVIGWKIFKNGGRTTIMTAFCTDGP